MVISAILAFMRDLQVALVGLTAAHRCLAAGEKAVAPAGESGGCDADLAAQSG